MTEIVTYSLRNGRKHSTQYYQDIATFTDTFLAEAEVQIGTIVHAFQYYIEETNHEIPRTFAEYAFELLTLGTLWSIYADQAVGKSKTIQNFLIKLVQWRRKSAFLKPGIDFVRGLTAFSFLRSQQRRSHTQLTLDNLDQLLHWMAASGDFKEEVQRLQTWREFLTGQTPVDVESYLNRVLSLADWFESHSLTALGAYTPHVEQFLANTYPADYRWREDAILCGRQRVEYHMNMVGTEILNRAFRQEFLQTKRKLVLLPPCMKARQDGRCEATMTPFGEQCNACEPGCRVHQTTQLGKKHGFNVLILPHELSVFSNGNMAPKQDNSVGVVGVSCPLTNVTGGWETKRLGIPAQGVLLDYCGCSWHWHLAGGIPTDINFKQLLGCIGSNPQSPQMPLRSYIKPHTQA